MGRMKKPFCKYLLAWFGWLAVYGGLPDPAPVWAQCIPDSLTVCAGADDEAEIWINSNSIGTFNYANSSATVSCATFSFPTFLNASGTNLLAVRLRNFSPTQMWVNWSLEVGCSDGTQAYWNSSSGGCISLDTPDNCAVTTPAGAPGNWMEPSFTPLPDWSVPPAPVTAFVWGAIASDLETGAALPPLSMDGTGSAQSTCEVMFFRQTFQLFPRTLTPTFTPSWSPTPTYSLTPTSTPTPTGTFTQTHTATISPTWTNSFTPTLSPTWTRTNTPTRTPTWTGTPTWTFTSSHTPTKTLTPTFTDSPTITHTPTITLTPTVTSTRTITFTPTITLTPTITPTFPPGDGLFVSRNVFRPRLDAGDLVIRVSVSTAGLYSLKVYNSAGEKIRVLRDHRTAMGTYEFVQWDGRTDRGENAASGVYLFKLTTSYGRDSARVLLLR